MIIGRLRVWLGRHKMKRTGQWWDHVAQHDMLMHVNFDVFPTWLLFPCPPPFTTFYGCPLFLHFSPFFSSNFILFINHTNQFLKKKKTSLINHSKCIKFNIYNIMDKSTCHFPIIKLNLMIHHIIVIE